MTGKKCAHPNCFVREGQTVFIGDQCHLCVAGRGPSLAAPPEPFKIPSSAREVAAMTKLRSLGVCTECFQEFVHCGDEPFASCECAGSSEWTGDPPLLWALRRRAAGNAPPNTELWPAIARAHLLVGTGLVVSAAVARSDSTLVIAGLNAVVVIAFYMAGRVQRYRRAQWIKKFGPPAR